ncbi:helix-turn-helix transcriptional regulator [Consotaella salsifontis]|uniref:Predicted DNA-binding transcriptional regulator YafY, contains an HTH and WYL domains n=1 Tax=Consotaella salsifontis TaxID=1365950 RepID=A0A1T4S0D0_9HYPH|nr:YafY family protein [Consotaella salsifontis]SKA21251.1 Predicted DNA-binding transcriptional regulator YafY, contains an HTH and WYL domains [Consotaella salsifontis]
MSRSERLLRLLQVLRAHRRPVSGRLLAEETGVSLRTLYRDIASLQAQGAAIEGEAGVGYVLKPGFLLPPLMFSSEEIEALVLGSRWVAERGDGALSAAARGALAKIAAVLPEDLKTELQTSGLVVASMEIEHHAVPLALLRQAVRERRKLTIHYRDGGDAESRRTVWPFVLAFFDQVRMLVAWCELRQDFRHFRADRIGAAEMSGERYPSSRPALMKAWRDSQGITRTFD